MFKVSLRSLVFSFLNVNPTNAHVSSGDYIVHWDSPPYVPEGGFRVFKTTRNRYVAFTATLELEGNETPRDKIMCEGTHTAIAAVGTLTSIPDHVGRHFASFPQVIDFLVHGMYDAKLVITPIEDQEKN